MKTNVCAFFSFTGIHSERDLLKFGIVKWEDSGKNAKNK